MTIRIPELTTASTSAECRNWIENLHAQNLAFHLDDDPEDIGIFTAEEVERLRRCVPVLFEKLRDPFEVLVGLEARGP